MPTVVIAPSNVAAFPEGGGHFWVYLQYVLGLRQLGCQVYWLEAFRTKGRAERETGALAAFRARMEQHGLGAKVILYVTHRKEPPPEAPTEYVNMTRDEAEAIFERADLLVNFHYAISPGLLARFRRTAMVDIDPGLLQFWNRYVLRVAGPGGEPAETRILTGRLHASEATGGRLRGRNPAARCEHIKTRADTSAGGAVGWRAAPRPLRFRRVDEPLGVSDLSTPPERGPALCRKNRTGACASAPQPGRAPGRGA